MPLVFFVTKYLTFYSDLDSKWQNIVNSWFSQVESCDDDKIKIWQFTFSVQNKNETIYREWVINKGFFLGGGRYF